MRCDTNDPISHPGLTALFIRGVLGWALAVLFGAAGMFAVRLFNLSKLPAAGLTLGLFGLAGGVTLARLLQTAGGKVHPPQVLLLAATWSLCAIGGAFPLFFTMGTRLEMVMRTAYCFAIFGAAGGVITTRVMRSLFPAHAENDSIPGILTWVFSFSLAAVTVDVAGEWLQSLLPPSLAWPIAIVMMTVILGFGSGCSILQFFESGRGGWRALQIAKPYGISLADNQKVRPLRILIILCIPFYLNDFSNIFVKDWRWWLLIDYTSVKLFPFLVIFYLIRNRILNFRDFIGLERQSFLSFLSVVVLAVLAVLFIEQNGALLLKKLFRDVPLGGIPDIPDPLWKWIDLSAGLLMVGIFEEVVFRGYLHTVVLQYTRRPVVFTLVSAAAFGLIHWSGGLHHIILTSAAGAVFMLIYLRTYSLPAVILAHYIVNFVDFGGIIPPSLFCFISVPPIR